MAGASAYESYEMLEGNTLREAEGPGNENVMSRDTKESITHRPTLQHSLEVSRKIIAFKLIDQTIGRNVCRRIQPPDLRNKSETR